jgi:hypothetical protein
VHWKNRNKHIQPTMGVLSAKLYVMAWSEHCCPYVA